MGALILHEEGELNIHSSITCTVTVRAMHRFSFTNSAMITRPSLRNGVEVKCVLMVIRRFTDVQNENFPLIRYYILPKFAYQNGFRIKSTNRNWGID